MSIGVRDQARFRRAFEEARQFSARVIIEELIEGRDYRVLVVGGRVVAASEREPASVTGNGTHTVRQLVESANEDPRRGEQHESPLTRLTLDEGAAEVLGDQGLTPDSVPAARMRVRIRGTANLSTGGTAEDVTGQLHPELAAMCERAARLIGLDPCGVDLIARNASFPPRPGDAAIIELNASPGLRMHHFPAAGPPRDAGAAIVDALFPPGSPSRIPVVSITGTNGKTTTTRLASHALARAGRRVGMTTSDGVFVGGCLVATGDLTGPQSARAVLNDPSVDVAVLETARGGIQRRGLGYDWSDVRVVTNIQIDHLGQDGLEDLEDLVFVKSLVAERVREGGRLVLNADDAESLGLMDNPRVRRLTREIALFSVSGSNFAVHRHLAEGGVGYAIQRQRIVELAEGRTRTIADVASLPLALGGAARFNLSNALAAVASCRALGVQIEVIADALASFDVGSANPGRVNAFRVGRGYALLDYGHNPAAVAAIGELAGSWGGRRVTAVLSVPGDRSDTLIEAGARAAARAFERIVVREDHDRRGRPIGEVARAMGAVIRSEAPACECTEILDEQEAMRVALTTMQEDEVVVAFYDDFAAARALLAQHGAEPIVQIPALDASRSRRHGKTLARA